MIAADKMKYTAKGNKNCIALHCREDISQNWCFAHIYNLFLLSMLKNVIRLLTLTLHLWLLSAYQQNVHLYG